MAFISSYKQKRDPAFKDEVRYNIARSLQLLGLNIGAEKIYMQLVEDPTCNQEILQRASFNLS